MDQRLEILLQEIRDGIPYSGINKIAGELEELNQTMKQIKAYLAQLASKKNG